MEPYFSPERRLAEVFRQYAAGALPQDRFDDRFRRCDPAAATDLSAVASQDSSELARPPAGFVENARRRLFDRLNAAEPSDRSTCIAQLPPEVFDALYRVAERRSRGDRSGPVATEDERLALRIDRLRFDEQSFLTRELSSEWKLRLKIESPEMDLNATHGSLVMSALPDDSLGFRQFELTIDSSECDIAALTYAKIELSFKNTDFRVLMLVPPTL